MNKIFCDPSGGLGDLWSMVSESILEGSCVYSNHHMHTRTKPQIYEIFGCLETIKTPIFTDKNPNVHRVRVEDVRRPYIQTGLKWKQKLVQPIITYQVYSPNAHCLPKKNMKKYDHFKWEMFIQKHKSKIKFIPLGKEYSLKEITRFMSMSIFFFGICSGMSHIAHSVGVPTLIWDWVDLQKYHPNKLYHPIEDISQIESFV